MSTIPRNISEKGLAFIKEVEGSESKVYLDSAGLPTIGVGHLLTQDELTSGKIKIGDKVVKYGKGLTDTEITKLLWQDLERFVGVVNSQVRVPVTQNEFDTLVSFSFNVGTYAFKNSTLLKLLNAGKKDEVPNQLRRWIHSAGKVVKGLVNRREKEVALWRTAYVYRRDV